MDPLTRNNVTVAGNPRASTTLVFVNGLGTDQTCWSKVTPAFADDFQLVLFDHVGSLKANQPYFREHKVSYLNVSGYAADLLEICSVLGLGGETILVGHSIGAMAGLLASIQRPGQFKRLVLNGASPRYVDGDGYRGGFSKDDINATYDALSRNYAEWSKALALAVTESPEQVSLASRFIESIASIPQDLMLTIMCSVLQTDHRDDLPKVRVPTLVVQTRKDCFVPMAVAEYLKDGIPDCGFAVIDAAGHLPHMSAPEIVVSAISDFIRQAELPATGR